MLATDGRFIRLRDGVRKDVADRENELLQCMDVSALNDFKVGTTHQSLKDLNRELSKVLTGWKAAVAKISKSTNKEQLTDELNSANDGLTKTQDCINFVKAITCPKVSSVDIIEKYASAKSAGMKMSTCLACINWCEDLVWGG